MENQGKFPLFFFCPFLFIFVGWLLFVFVVILLFLPLFNHF